MADDAARELGEAHDEVGDPLDQAERRRPEPDRAEVQRQHRRRRLVPEVGEERREDDPDDAARHPSAASAGGARGGVAAVHLRELRDGRAPHARERTSALPRRLL
jgi:hypothetical protein